ncbi:hypothetical protein WDU94_011471 [Cyamophila willieti]
MEKFNTSRPGYKMFASKVVNVEELLWIDAAELILFVASTTGEGDPPRNGRRFYDNCLMFRYFDHVPFQNVHFAVLGLGSRLYKQNFCAFGINLDKMAGDLGGTRMLPVAKCDTVVMEDTYNNWVDEIMPRVDVICKGGSIPHVIYNSTVPPGPGVTERDIIREIHNLAAQAGVTLQVLSTPCTTQGSNSVIELSQEVSEIRATNKSECL